MLFENGDYSRLARIYNQRHIQDGSSITAQYVRMIILGERKVSSQKSKEIRQLAERFSASKRAVTQEFVSAL